MYHDNALFFKFDALTKGFSEMSTLYYGYSNFSFTPLLYFLFNDFIAYIINIYIYILFGFFSMYFLLKKIGSIDKVLVILTSICFAIIPVYPTFGICVSTLPLIILVFIHFRSQNELSKRILLILVYPFFSSFTITGIFILGFWLLGLVVLSIETKKINPNLLVGFILLCIGYIIVDIRLFYVMFVLKTPLNRSIFNIHPIGIVAQIKLLLYTLKEYCIHGYYHAASFQRKIIMPLACIVSVFCLIMLIRRIISQSGKMTRKNKNSSGGK